MDGKEVLDFNQKIKDVDKLIESSKPPMGLMDMGPKKEKPNNGDVEEAQQMACEMSEEEADPIFNSPEVQQTIRKGKPKI